MIWTDADGVDQGALLDYELDLAYGIGDDPENDFSLTPMDGTRLSEGCLWYVDGTPWGGVVDDCKFDTSTGLVSYHGRSLQGVLDGLVVCPPAGSEHYRMEGEANDAIAALLAHVGLSGAATVPAGGSGVTLGHDLDRFCTAWEGLVDACREAGARPELRLERGTIVVTAVPRRTWGSEVDSDLLDLSGTREWRPVNHLVCAGEGEGGERAVVHLYADAEGRVSRSQSLFGLDERAELYDYTSADEGELVERGTERLSDKQGDGEVEVTVKDGSLDMEVGDVAVGRASSLGLVVEAEVAKKIVRATGLTVAVSHEAGRASARRG